MGSLNLILQRSGHNLSYLYFCWIVISQFLLIFVKANIYVISIIFPCILSLTVILERRKMKNLVFALCMFAYVNHSLGASGIPDDEAAIFEKLEAWMLTKEAELKENNNAWMLTKEAELKEKNTAWMLTKEAELKEKIKEELKAELSNKGVGDAYMDPDICPNSCTSLMEFMEMNVISNSMSIRTALLDIANLRSDIMDDVEKLSANDSRIERALQNEIELNDDRNNEIQT